MLIPSLIILLAFTASRNANAECNVCQTNGAACINSTSFYLCYGNKFPNYDNLYHCKTGFDCTNFNSICIQSNSAQPASCGDTSLCGQCRAHRNYLFACTSRSTFRMCYGAAQPKSELGYCPDGFVCDATSDNVCILPRQDDHVTCDLENPIDTNPGNTTPIDDPNYPSPGTPREVCNRMQKVGVYQIPGDTSCLEYIWCYMQNGLIYGTLLQCPANTYFSGDTLQCVLKKPLHCA